MNSNVTNVRANSNCWSHQASPMPSVPTAVGETATKCCQRADSPRAAGLHPREVEPNAPGAAREAARVADKCLI
jgi:hypothetical protein